MLSVVHVDTMGDSDGNAAFMLQQVGNSLDFFERCVVAVTSTSGLVCQAACHVHELHPPGRDRINSTSIDLDISIYHI